MRSRNLLAVLYCIIMGMVFCTSSYAADYKVGYINLQRLVNESKAGKDSQAQIAKMRAEKQAIIDSKRRDLEKFQKFINEEGAKMPAEEKRKKQKALQQAVKEYKRLVADSKEDIARQDRELVRMILEKTQDIVKDVAKKNKYTMILKDANAIGYLDPEVDITDEVIKELNKKK